jgi:circadian clock protein KaiB
MTRRALYQFRLYTADSTQNSAEALANLTRICQKHLANLYSIEVIDVFQYPKRALADDIRMTPTLLKLSPAPAQRIVGTLRRTDRVLLALGLEALDTDDAGVASLPPPKIPIAVIPKVPVTVIPKVPVAVIPKVPTAIIPKAH